MSSLTPDLKCQGSDSQLQPLWVELVWACSDRRVLHLQSYTNKCAHIFGNSRKPLWTLNQILHQSGDFKMHPIGSTIKMTSPVESMGVGYGHKFSS